tara:strand:- start:2065 stop:2751 length:687 start_codon:yes stop_codon:yes gene_type:complete
MTHIQNDKPVIIYGNGHMANMLFHFMKVNHDIACFAVDDHCITNDIFESLPVIPFSQIENRFPPATHNMIISIGFCQMNSLRKRKYLESIDKGYQLINYIHSSVVIHDTNTLGQNNIILDHASIHPNTKIGNGNFISSNGNLGHGCTVGDFCWINAGVCVGGESQLGSQSFLGMNATIGHGIKIADESFIGAHTLVAHDTFHKEVYLSENGVKHRLDSDHFLKFSSVT